MTERERLLNLLKQNNACAYMDCEACMMTKKNLQCIPKDITDYLLDNGVIVPPCEVGDKLYTVIYDNVPKKWYIAEDNISEVGKKGLFISSDDGFFDYIPYSEIGKYYFLNREEAEKDCFMQQSANELLKNGVIVPPLKIGQAVYRVQEGEITAVEETKMPDGEKTFYNMQIGGAGYFFEETDIGKTVFLAKEEAEKALEEMEK